MQAAFLFKIPDLLVFLLGDGHIHESDFQVDVNTSLVVTDHFLLGVQLLDGITDPEHGLIFGIQRFPDGDVAVSLPVQCPHADAGYPDQALLTEVPVHAAVHNPQLADQPRAGCLLGIVAVHKPVVQRADDRRDERVQHNAYDDDGRRNAGLVPAETMPGVLHVADRLVFKNLVGNAFSFMDKGEALFGEIHGFHLIVCHLISPPF